MVGCAPSSATRDFKKAGRFAARARFRLKPDVDPRLKKPDVDHAPALPRGAGEARRLGAWPAGPLQARDQRVALEEARVACCELLVRCGLRMEGARVATAPEPKPHARELRDKSANWVSFNPRSAK